ncbi:PRC-barrel domain-containing protein [Methylobacterium phyllosphaerae]
MRLPLLASALLLAGLATASAQTDGTKPDGGGAATPVPAAPAPMADSLRPTFVAQAPDDMVASKLIGSSVVNGANETIGQIADFVLDQKGAVKAWIIGVGGFPGDRLEIRRGRPLRAQARPHRRQDPSSARIDTTKDQLRAAPEYVYLGKEPPKGAAPASPAGEPAQKP